MEFQPTFEAVRDKLSQVQLSAALESFQKARKSLNAINHLEFLQGFVLLLRFGQVVATGIIALIYFYFVYQHQTHECRYWPDLYVCRDGGQRPGQVPISYVFILTAVSFEIRRTFFFCHFSSHVGKKKENKLFLLNYFSRSHTNIRPQPHFSSFFSLRSSNFGPLLSPRNQPQRNQIFGPKTILGSKVFFSGLPISRLLPSMSLPSFASQTLLFHRGSFWALETAHVVIAGTCKILVAQLFCASAFWGSMAIGGPWVPCKFHCYFFPPIMETGFRHLSSLKLIFDKIYRISYLITTTLYAIYSIKNSTMKQIAQAIQRGRISLTQIESGNVEETMNLLHQGMEEEALIIITE